MTISPTSEHVRRVLIVDDAADLRLLVRYVLQLDPDFDVVGEAEDGMGGITEATRLQPDLVLLDMSMPGMDGLEALPRIRSAVPDVTVVVLSGFSTTAMASAALSAGAVAYLEKGVPPSELLINIREVLGLEAREPVLRRRAAGEPSSRP